ncbi:LysR substrate-binding domain-containing protein [Aquabacterium sp. OR-4]|uniref:LysR substrate-binding domain-containing protein n=1 Tax=Aquabacterium sp. OR-4 TaxID=2978127 RepID=UPI0028C70439|nr:LysR substrate-binding domain-containing protein [Aquabacterium sp. OR-4]MDT7837015.1 LysR substrate-binding domain-containing protein [Aquabacterium sp. OR-4]
MAHLPLNPLPAFVRVARMGGLRAAAESLHLTHGAVSQQIRHLEQQLGFALFERRGRRLVINAAGQALLAAAEPALAQLEAGQRAAERAAGAAGQLIRLATMNSMAQRWLLPRMARWRERHPDIAVDLHASMQTLDLTAEGFDAALRYGHGRWRGLLCERLPEWRLVPVATPARARRVARLPLAQWAGEPLLGDAAKWGAWFAAAGAALPTRALQVVASSNDAGLVAEAAEQDLGLALVREMFAADALAAGRLQRLPGPSLAADADDDGYWLVMPRARRDWPPLMSFRDWLFEELALSQRGLASVASALASPRRRPA